MLSLVSTEQSRVYSGLHNCADHLETQNIVLEIEGLLYCLISIKQVQSS